MRDRPAGAESPPLCDGHRDLDRRMREFLGRLGAGGESRLTERLLPAGPFDEPHDPRPGTAGFPWLLIAEWLAERFELTASEEGRALVAELRWIQYCIYGLFRAQDDLVDGDTDDVLLTIEANHLLAEATRSAARHFDAHSPLWTILTDSIDATSRAIVRLDEIQSVPEREPHGELVLYRDLSACLEIAAAGIAIAAGRRDAWEEAISPALGRLAVAGQILDDLFDLSEDLEGGHVNYAAWYLCRPVFGSTPEAIEAVVASNLATTDRLDGLLSTAGGLLREAARLVSPALCPRTHAYLLDYERSLEGLGRSISEGCEAFFAPSVEAA